MNSVQDEKFLQEAIRLAKLSVSLGGGPFGAVVVKDNTIIGSGHNQVTLNNDPTAHAEVNAIRDACANINHFDLSDCTIYSSCEPCPMCFSAIYWSRISRLVYAASGNDAADAGFDDTTIASEICLPYEQRTLAIEQVPCKEKLDSFILWQNKGDKTPY